MQFIVFVTNQVQVRVLGALLPPKCIIFVPRLFCSVKQAFIYIGHISYSFKHIYEVSNTRNGLKVQNTVVPRTDGPTIFIKIPCIHARRGHSCQIGVYNHISNNTMYKKYHVLKTSL